MDTDNKYLHFLIDTASQQAESHRELADLHLEQWKYWESVRITALARISGMDLSTIDMTKLRATAKSSPLHSLSSFPKKLPPFLPASWDLDLFLRSQEHPAFLSYRQQASNAANDLSTAPLSDSLSSSSSLCVTNRSLFQILAQPPPSSSSSGVLSLSSSASSSPASSSPSSSAASSCSSPSASSSFLNSCASSLSVGITSSATTLSPSPTLRMKPIVCWVKARYNAQGNVKGQLQFTVGDYIAITYKEGNWWKGRLNGKDGIVPYNYMQVCDAPSQSVIEKTLSGVSHSSSSSSSSSLSSSSSSASSSLKEKEKEKEKKGSAMTTVVVYELTSLARQFLLESSSHSLAGYILHSNDVIYRLFGKLDASVRSGESAWKEAFGMEGSNLWNHVYRDDKGLTRFLLAMHSYAQSYAPSVVRAFDLSSYQVLLDLGSGLGTVAVAALQQYSKLRAIAADLPSVVCKASGFWSEQTERGVLSKSITSRLSHMTVDFFEDHLPASDLIVLSRILHDWDEKSIQKLLRKVYHSLPEHGALLIAELFLDADKCGPKTVVLQSLNMLVQMQGRERTQTEYREMLRDAGFSKIDILSDVSASPPVGVILAVKS
eukprot:TRINITY_DN77_c2_g2_i1.p1 TRINITY_DN77_c2_g2~~TRINITY_DN77_c2_g2_i1.p1  ORF type:complete len:604 (+),score=193.89 TRINITY_DN77_c2_g2_i1:111-1922(+)